MISLRHRRVAWLIALFAILCVALIAHWSRQRFLALQDEVKHTIAVREAISATVTLLVDAETGQRGYLLTGDQAFLQPLEGAQKKIEARIRTLRDVTRGDAQQEPIVRRIENLAGEKLAFVEETITLKKRGDDKAPIAMLREGRGKRIMDAIRNEANVMLEREQKSLDARHEATRIAQRRTSVALLGGLGTALILVLGGLAMVRRDMEEARLASLKMSESERTFRLLADNASDLIRILDEDGSHLYVSPSSKRLLGYRAEEVRAMPPESLLPPEERDSFFPGHGDMTSRGTTNIVHRMRCKNGEYRWFETRIAPALYQQDGRPRLHLSSRDITSRKQAEDDLRRQKALLQSIVTNMGDGLVVVDSNRRFVMINPAIARYFSQQVGDRSSQSWATNTQTFLPDGTTALPPEEGPLTRALAGESSDSVEIVMRHESGEQRRFAVTARPIRDAESEQITSAVGVFHDISAQRQAELDLVESEQRWRVFSEASFEGLAITRSDHILDTNATIATWLGRDASELVGLEGLTLFAPEDRARVRQLTMSKSQGAFEAHLLRKDGTKLAVEVRGRAVVFRGQHVHIAVIRDITERKAQERELARHAERLRELSLRDELTTLYNRRGFLELSRQQLLLAARARRAFAVFYADLNGMKQINDQLGHEMGDRALVATGRILGNVFRASDIIARLGGDEFAVLATACDADGVEKATARVRKLVEEHNATSGEPFQLSVSVGAAVYDPAAPVTLEALMQQADERMYAFKKERHDRLHDRNQPRGVATG
jgi:diguanylate cyclase (GGDEF)-like protein/PAS domain S-box-containing protein